MNGVKASCQRCHIQAGVGLLQLVDGCEPGPWHTRTTRGCPTDTHWMKDLVADTTFGGLRKLPAKPKRKFPINSAFLDGKCTRYPRMHAQDSHNRGCSCRHNAHGFLDQTGTLVLARAPCAGSITGPDAARGAPGAVSPVEGCCCN